MNDFKILTKIHMRRQMDHNMARRQFLRQQGSKVPDELSFEAFLVSHHMPYLMT
jgi:hypothetical protein